MISTIDLCYILLTYKGKILLLQQENVLADTNVNAWHLIKKTKAKDTSPEAAIIREVQKETNIKLDEVTLLAKVASEGTVQYLFHTKLSDKHVNNINRGEGRVLQFFGLNELAKLQIQSSSKSFLSHNVSILKNIAIS